MSLLPNDVTERSLWHLSACRAAADALERSGDDALLGPTNSSWADLLAAIMEGFERGWVGYAETRRVDGQTRLLWRATPLGDREIDAFRVRLRDAPIIDETDKEK